LLTKRNMDDAAQKAETNDVFFKIHCVLV